MKTLDALALSCALLFATAAQAGPAAEAARLRIEAIAAGQVDAITADYAKRAELHWVGGPLDGTYGNGKVREVWTKFGKANGPMQVTIGDVTESVNPKGATVAANLMFSGKNTIKVRYVLVYREGRLVSEIWQIDPNLAV